MINDILTLVAQHEFLTTTSHLMMNGHSRRSIDRAIAQKLLIRVCRGWVATRDARQDAVLAVLHRGKLAGPSALASRQTWDAAATRLHVQRSPNSHGPVHTGIPLEQFRRREHQPTGVVTRWRPERYPDVTEPPWRQSVIDALSYVAKFASYEQFIACVDSALHNETLSSTGLRILSQLVPASVRDFIVDVEPRSEAGIETLSRVRLAPFVRQIDPQYPVPGISRLGLDGRIDLLLDRWLAFEADGDGWHDPGADRRRDQKLILRGFQPVHFGYAQIIHDWPEVEAAVRELLRYPPLARAQEETPSHSAPNILPKRLND